VLELVRDRVAAPAPHDLSSLRNALVEHPNLVFDLLEPFIAGGTSDRVLAAVGWLADGHHLTGALRPLQATLLGQPIKRDDLWLLWKRELARWAMSLVRADDGY
jgi:hypothetical protein